MSDQQLDEVVATSDEGLRAQALRRLKKRRAFRTHVFAYVVVNTLGWGAWAIIAATASHSWYPWPLWLTLGWGIGLIFNAWDAYFRRPISEGEIRGEIDRLGHQHRGMDALVVDESMLSNTRPIGEAKGYPARAIHYRIPRSRRSGVGAVTRAG